MATSESTIARHAARAAGLRYTSDAQAGLREILLVFEQLGRASCPVPLLGAVAANLALAHEASNSARAFVADLHAGKATVALGMGVFDGDGGAGHVDMRGNAVRGRLSFIEGAKDGFTTVVRLR